MDSTVDLSLWQLVAASVYVLVTLILVRWLGIPREREIISATLRMTIQLFIAGYLLTFVFDHPNFFTVLAILIVMLTFAVINSIRRINEHVPVPLRKVMAVSLVTGSVSSLGFFLLVIVQHGAWQDPRYVIPIAGMIVGNSMTGVALGASRLIQGMEDRRTMIEAALMLGATPRTSTRRVVQQAFDAAILPTVNTMVGIGIVSLPGMMTGQILAGQDPQVAIRYQIAIMVGIMAAVAVSVVILVEWGYRSFFTPAAQLMDEECTP
jgi:putative ABC transport system permease protein